MAKSENDDVVGFCAFTYEYCDKQNATYFQMQGLHVAAQPDCSQEAAIIETLKTALDAHRANFELRCCGILLLSPKVAPDVAEQAIRVFNLETTKYQIYHLDLA